MEPSSNMVIPAILAKSQKEFKEKLDLISPYTDIIQIDAMDGVFVPNTTWADAEEIKSMRLPMRFEAHLMVKNPEDGSPQFGGASVIEEWAKAGAFRIIFHIEATKKAGECVRQIKKFHRETGIAINPKTPIEKIKPFLKKIDYILVMGVDPGFSGQKFQAAALQKIKQVRKLSPKAKPRSVPPGGTTTGVKIGVDGGVDKINAKKLYAAGADNLNAASSIFKSKNIAKAINDLL